MAEVRTTFDCKHDVLLHVDIEDDVRVAEHVRGLGKCPECRGEADLVPIAGVAPGPGGRDLVLDSIHMMPL